MNNTPLVSVPVVTYNSAKTVIETLDSIAAQTYQNIELIVSDDCSTDNTVELCRAWIASHKDRFVRTELITSERNTGISGNGNRARSACKGQWIKGIAGDDIMLNDCIVSFLDYQTSHPDFTYIFCRVRCFGKDAERVERMTQYFNYDFFSWTREEQMDYLTIEGNCIPAPGFFYHREAMDELGIYNDERVPQMEDRAKWINMLKKGVHFGFIDKELVLYRMSDNSLSTQKEMGDQFKRSYILFYKYYGFHNTFKKRNKKEAVYRYLRGELYLHNNHFIWKVICKIYKIIVLHRF